MGSILSRKEPSEKPGAIHLQSLPISGALMFPNYRDYDLAPDGNRFVMIVPEDREQVGRPPQLRVEVVLNWTEELKQRVPTR
jgi:hypothetical protein